MLWDLPGMIKSVADLVKTGLEKFVKDVNEKRKDERLRAEDNFKKFWKEVRDEEAKRKSDLNSKP